MKILYFAWVRERVGKAEETLDLPSDVATVADLVDWLAGRGDEYAHAFADPKVVRAALDRNHVKADTPLAGAHEIAFFPPMTGGWTVIARGPGGLSPMAVGDSPAERRDFDAGAEAAAMTRGRTDIGAVVTFTGICRDNEAGHGVAAMTLEHYPGHGPKPRSPVTSPRPRAAGRSWASRSFIATAAWCRGTMSSW